MACRIKLKAVYKGRKAVIDPAKLRKLQAAGLGATEIAQKLGIGRASVYWVTSGVRGSVR